MRKRFLKNPSQNFLIFYIFACHGIQKEGSQSIVINEIDPDAEFYRLWPAEADMRDWSEKFRNTYHVGLFACCREIHDPQKNTGYIGGTYQQVMQKIGGKVTE